MEVAAPPGDAHPENDDGTGSFRLANLLFHRFAREGSQQCAQGSQALRCRRLQEQPCGGDRPTTGLDLCVKSAEQARRSSPARPWPAVRREPRFRRQFLKPVDRHRRSTNLARTTAMNRVRSAIAIEPKHHRGLSLPPRVPATEPLHDSAIAERRAPYPTADCATDDEVRIRNQPIVNGLLKLAVRTLPAMTNVNGYLRVSTDEQARSGFGVGGATRTHPIGSGAKRLERGVVHGRWVLGFQLGPTRTPIPPAGFQVSILFPIPQPVAVPRCSRRTSSDRATGPAGRAFAELSGLPAVTGLHTSVLALLGCAVFGPRGSWSLDPIRHSVR